jgi:hypothetical protein
MYSVEKYCTDLDLIRFNIIAIFMKEDIPINYDLNKMYPN